MSAIALSSCKLGVRGESENSSLSVSTVSGDLVTAPSSLTYSSTYEIFLLNETITDITATMGGSTAEFTISPDLPDGLSIDSSTGTISGTVAGTATKATVTHTITATNSAGSTTATFVSRTNAGYRVDSELDTSDASTGDDDCDTGAGICTLRAAIEEANATAGTQMIVIPADHTTTLGSVLSVTEAVSILGYAEATSKIDGGSATGLFSVSANVGLTLEAVTLQNGSAGGGGAVTLATGATSTLTATYVTFNANTATAANSGGAVRFAGDGTFNGTEVTFTNNTAGGYGGAIVLGNSSNLTLTKSYFYNNYNTTSGYLGGAIYTTGTDATIKQSLFEANYTANHGGGAIGFGSGFGTLTMENSTFSGNYCNNAGGAIYFWGTTATVTNNTFIGNDSTGTANGGAWINVGGTSTLKNNIFYDNDGTGGEDNCYPFGGSMTSAGDNISGTASGDCNFVHGDDIVSTDPVLGSLQDNGGFSKTYSPAGGSPAIDAGNNTGCPAEDQIGTARPQNGTCDIGAFEVE